MCLNASNGLCHLIIQVHKNLSCDSHLHVSELAVHLRRSNIGMAQQFLYRTEFHPTFEHQNSERVPQHMRCDDPNTGLTCIALDDQPEALPCQPLAMMIE